MQTGNAAREDRATANLWKEGGVTVIEHLAAVYSQCLKTSSVPEPWMNADIILIHMKSYVKELKNYRQISLLPDAYKLFTKAIGNRVR